jgi:hypothetical protein
VATINDVKLTRVVFGIRFDNRFSLEDVLGEVVDDILGSDGWGPERFAQIGYGPGGRQLFNESGSETINLTRNDAIFESKVGAFSIEELSDMSEEFVGVIWSAVSNRLDKKPSINRYGCVVGFDLPKTWDPIKALFNQESYETSEFVFRYSKRLPNEKGLTTAGVNDYNNAIVQVTFRGGKGNAFIDYQHYFDPALESERAKKDFSYTRFIDRAVSYFRESGWELLQTRLQQQLPKAA